MWYGNYDISEDIKTFFAKDEIIYLKDFNQNVPQDVIDSVSTDVMQNVLIE